MPELYLEDLLSGTLAHFPGDLDGVIMNAVGNLGLVDPNQVRSDIAEELVSTLVGDLAHSDGIYAGVEIANEVDRQLTRTQINTVLGQEGQDTVSSKITWLEDTLAQVQQQADSAQAAISTQDAIKHMAQQNAMETQVLGALQSELLQARQDTPVDQPQPEQHFPKPGPADPCPSFAGDGQRRGDAADYLPGSLVLGVSRC
jgi:hypothetical protein